MSAETAPELLEGWDAISEYLANRWGLRRTPRRLRDCRDGDHPIPVFTIAGGIAALRGDLDAWIRGHSPSQNAGGRP